MNEPFTFVVRHRAAPQGSKTLDKGKRGKPFMRESSAGVRPFRTAVRRAAADETGRPRAQFIGPVAVSVSFEFKQAKSNTDLYPTGKNIGDLDKLTRAVLDGLTEAEVIEDDAWVINLRDVTKRWGDEDRVIIVVSSIEEERVQSVVDFAQPINASDLDEMIRNAHLESPFRVTMIEPPYPIPKVRNPFESYGPCVGCGEGDEGTHSDGSCIR